MEVERRTLKPRPTGRIVQWHTWSELSFLHWRVPAEVLRPLIPAALSLDTYDGSAWIGLVPFHMSGVRLRGLPEIPGLREFHETNVRTYVSCGGEPGVWFFSLDAESALAVWGARTFWRLPYHRAALEIESSGAQRRYRGWRRRSSAGYSIAGDIAPERFVAAEGSLEHFLVERYSLYATARNGSLRRGRVHHSPYPLQQATLTSCDETMLAANGLSVEGPPVSALFSAGVCVEIYGLDGVV